MNFENIIEQLIKESDLEKLHIEYWKKHEGEEIADCIVKVSVEKEWV